MEVNFGEGPSQIISFAYPQFKKVLAYLEKNQKEEALLELEKIIQESQKAKEQSLEVAATLLLAWLHRLAHHYKKAWKVYEKLEKLLPNEPSIKLLVSQFLIDLFKQYDLAQKKIQKILQMTSDPALRHQSFALLGQIHFKKGNYKKALESFELAKEAIAYLNSASSIDYTLYLLLLDKGLEKGEDCNYLKAAFSCAQQHQEEKEIYKINYLMSLSPFIGV